MPIDKLNLLLCGGVGAGKSSIVSLIHSIIKGRTSAVALHGTGSSSVTPDLTKYRFKQPGSTVKPKPVKWQLWDTMGWGVDDYKGGELAFILDGNLPHGCDLRQRLSTKTPKFKVKPSLEEEVHCMCLVVPSNAATDEKYMARLQEMRQAALERRKAALLLFSAVQPLQVMLEFPQRNRLLYCAGIPTVIFLTKIDAYDPDVVGKDLTKTFHSSKLLELCKVNGEPASLGSDQKDIGHES